MKYKKSGLRSTTLKTGRLIGGIAWRWFKAQPIIKDRVHRAEEHIEQLKTHLKTHLQELESDFWEWIRKLEEEERRSHPSRSGPSLEECYSLLKIPQDTPFLEIKKAWREQMRAHHPDQFAQHPEKQRKAEEQARRINEAYQKIKLTLGV